MSTSSTKARQANNTVPKIIEPEPILLKVNRNVRGIATTVDRGISVVDESGSARSGIYGISISGTHGFSEADDYGLAISGDEGVSKVGLFGIALTGKDGIVSFKYWNGLEFVYASFRCQDRAESDTRPYTAWRLRAPQLITQQIPNVGTGYVAIGNFDRIPMTDVLKTWPKLKEYLPKHL